MQKALFKLLQRFASTENNKNFKERLTYKKVYKRKRHESWGTSLKHDHVFRKGIIRLSYENFKKVAKNPKGEGFSPILVQG